MSQRTELGIFNEKDVDGFHILSINTKKATYQGTPWGDLNDFLKRKFENFAFLQFPDIRNHKLKFLYYREEPDDE